MNRIRDKVGILGKKDLDLQELAGYIFESEFSTKSSVSSISGRGIGMMAIADELKSLGGGISLVFMAAEAQGFQAFTFVIRWPSQVSNNEEIIKKPGK